MMQMTFVTKKSLIMSMMLAAFCVPAQLTVVKGQTADGEGISAVHQLIDNGNLESAMTKIDAIIKSEPNNAAAYAERARAEYLSKKPDAAQADADKALSLDAKSFEAFNIRGLLKRERKDDDGAVSEFTSAIAANPQFAKAFYNRAAVYGTQKKYDLAVADLNAAVSMPGDKTRIYTLRGQIYETQNKYSLAIADFTEAVKLSPNDAVLYGRRGNVYMNTFQNELAISDYQKSLALDAKNESVKANLDKALIRRKYLKPGAVIDAARADALSNDGFEAFNRQDYNAAVKAYSQCLAAVSFADGCYTGRADAYRKLEKYDEAIADYAAAAELSPKNAKTYGNRGLAYFKKKDYQNAIKDYDRAIALTQTESYYYLNRAASYANLGKPADGEADIKKALQMSPNDQTIKEAFDNIEAQIHPPGQRVIDGGADTEELSTGKEYFDRGKQQFADKKYEKSVASLTGCINLEPTNYSCYYQRAVAYDSWGKTAEALADVNKTLEIEPTYALALDAKPKLEKLIAAKAVNAGVEKEFDGYFNEYDRLAYSMNDASDSLNALYKKYTSVDMPNDLDDLRPLNDSQKTEMCRIVTQLNGYEQTREQLQSKMEEMFRAGKLDQTPELKEKRKNSEELFIMSGGSDRNRELKEYLGCAAPK